MRKLISDLTALIIIICFTGRAIAANTVQTVTQVTQSVTVSTAVDYTITGDTPFATAGSINITNTDHAVVIIEKVKPSKVINSLMGFIYINGAKAQNDVNCQVKMHANGSIIMPYPANFHPLTVYSEPNFGGEAVDNFGLENTGGYMNTLTAAKLNNRIRSFRLKRGYMVTFALGNSGWGYSRCFIAADEDLEMANLPSNMDGRISSYRLFKWNDAKKSGLASDTRYEATQATNASWCYDWGVGVNRLPDTECVPNHIYEDYPSSSSCGSVSYACHMKANNEPGNSADDHPQDVSTVLANWQNLMRTGLRLCSETSHDGSMNHLKSFCDSIDAYGWRCDIVDLHCYWDTGTFNSLTWYSDNYANGRPIWISEWVWGASWNNNGIFSAAPDGKNSYSTRNQQACYNGTKPILDVLNSNPRVERYAYWNSEADASKIYKDGKLSILGEYYASMKPGIGYRKENEYIPTVRYRNPSSLQGTFSKTKRTFALTWNDPNGDMVDSVTVECKFPGKSSYKQIATVEVKDANGKGGSSYTYTDTISEPGAYYYRVTSYPIGNKKPKYSDEVSVTVGSSAGNDFIQYGNLAVTSTAAITTDFAQEYTETPALFMGIPTNKNTTTTPCSLIGTVSKKNFTYTLFPWQKSGTQTISSAETIPFMALPYGSHTYGDMIFEVGSAKVKSDTTQVTFAQPFPEGVTPVIITEIKQTLKSNPMMARIWDVTNTGFKVVIRYEEGVGTKIAIAQTLMYMAVTPGQCSLGDGIMMSAGTSTELLYSNIARAHYFTNADGDTLQLDNPFIFGAAQTYNVPTGIVLRKSIDRFINIDGKQYTIGTSVKRCVDGSSSEKGTTKATGDTFGWITISTASRLLGDANSDGTVDVSDIATIAGYILGDETEQFDAQAADFNRDGTIDVTDISLTANYILFPN